MEKVFYILRGTSPDRMVEAKNSFESLIQHYSLINILIPQAYRIDEKGIVWGEIDNEILIFAKQKAIKLMPLITNTEFNKDIVHQFLSNPVAQTKAIQSLIDICLKQKFYGVQLDFEMVGIEDRDALTRFYQAAANALHQKGFIVSFALAPVTSDPPFNSDFLKKIYVNWEGAYDFEKLGKAADFVTIMAYNQHGGVTSPGATASLPWMEATIKYALQYIPAEKISLGIPDYSTYWYTSTDNGFASGKTMVKSVGINFAKTQYLIQKFNIHLLWDDHAKINYGIIENNWLNEYLFVEDAKSFKLKLALVNKYHLRGISVFDLGTEDQAIWQILSASKV